MNESSSALYTKVFYKTLEGSDSLGVISYQVTTTMEIAANDRLVVSSFTYGTENAR